MHDESLTDEYAFATALGVSEKAIMTLTKGNSRESILADLQRLRRDCRDLYPEGFTGEQYETLLWTLLGELSIPRNLGEAPLSRWPLLLFPFAQQYIDTIVDFVTGHGFSIALEEALTFSPRLHACLYGGQAWYPSLLQAYESLPHAWDHHARLFWITSTDHNCFTLAALARKMQLQLRPTMMSFERPCADSIYPGIVRAFHTPHLGNVAIHSAIFSLKTWI